MEVQTSHASTFQVAARVTSTDTPIGQIRSCGQAQNQGVGKDLYPVKPNQVTGPNPSGLFVEK